MRFLKKISEKLNEIEKPTKISEKYQKTNGLFVFHREGTTELGTVSRKIYQKRTGKLKERGRVWKKNTKDNKLIENNGKKWKIMEKMSCGIINRILGYEGAEEEEEEKVY